MKVEIPIVAQLARIETESELDAKTPDAKTPDAKTTVKVYQVQPLFVDGIYAQDRDLQRAMEKLVRDLQKTLSKMARGGRHQEVSRCIFSPDVHIHKLTLRLELRHSKPRILLPIATFQQRGDRIAFSPYLSDLWFELSDAADLTQTASAVYSDYFKAIEKRQGASYVQRIMKRFEVIGKIRLEYAEFDLDMGQVVEAEQGMLQAIGDASERVDGRTELERVGRCLDHAYPSQLNRYLCDPSPLAAVLHAVQSPERRGVLVVGRPSVGKTSLIHELVYRRVAARESSYSQTENIWLLSPQRLISGMKYVGQWENRLLAILKHVQRRAHILYFDDLLGLLQAGRTCSSDLSVADVLRPFLERGDVRVLAEITPESLRVLRERDRSLADLFDLVHLQQPEDEQLFSILFDVIRRLEREHECRFDLNVLPTVLELTRRYQSDAAFPGKAVALLEQLAMMDSYHVPGSQIQRIDRKA